MPDANLPSFAKIAAEGEPPRAETPEGVTRRKALHVLGNVSMGMVLLGAAACGGSELEGRMGFDGDGGNPQDMPDGGIEEADGGNEPPDGGMGLADGGRPRPDGGVAQPDGGVVRPDGGVPQPDGGVVRPDGGAAGTPPECAGNLCINLAGSGATALGTVGGAMTAAAPNRDTLIIIRSDTSGYLALSNVCTHQGCAVRYSNTSHALSCPCHGATYTTDGTVTRGPASRPLRSYRTQVIGTTLVIFMN